jgi:hypothetical protein
VENLSHKGIIILRDSDEDFDYNNPNPQESWNWGALPFERKDSNFIIHTVNPFIVERLKSVTGYTIDAPSTNFIRFLSNFV